jgi:hypothetical protein
MEAIGDGAGAEDAAAGKVKAPPATVSAPWVLPPGVIALTASAAYEYELHIVKTHNDPMVT